MFNFGSTLEILSPLHSGLRATLATMRTHAPLLAMIATLAAGGQALAMDANSQAEQVVLGTDSAPNLGDHADVIEPQAHTLVSVESLEASLAIYSAGECDTDNDCEESEYCDKNVPGNPNDNVCKTEKDEGEICGRHGQCESKCCLWQGIWRRCQDPSECE